MRYTTKEKFVLDRLRAGDTVTRAEALWKEHLEDLARFRGFSECVEREAAENVAALIAAEQQILTQRWAI